MIRRIRPYSSFFFFNDTATTEIYTLSLHDALPICLVDAGLRRPHGQEPRQRDDGRGVAKRIERRRLDRAAAVRNRSEEHMSELQSQSNLVCRLLLEKKK